MQFGRKWSRLTLVVRELDIEIRTIQSEISLAEKGIAGSENVGAELQSRKEQLLVRHEMIKSSLDSTQKEDRDTGTVGCKPTE